MILRPAAIRPFEVYGPVFACARAVSSNTPFQVHLLYINGILLPIHDSFRCFKDKATVSRHLDGGVCLHDDPPV